MDFLIEVGVLNSIYPIIITVILIAFIFSFIKKYIPKIKVLETPLMIIGGLLVFASIIIFPSIPRYHFEEKTLKELEKSKDWIKILNETKIGSFTEPLTWFKAPVGSFHILMPSPLNYGMEENSFMEVFINYGEEQTTRLIEVDCNDKSIIYAVPKDGTYKYTSNEYQTMNEKEINLFCDYSWTKEREALRNHFVKSIK